MLHAVGRTEFDHAVVMVRDRLDALAPHFERQGFHLSDKAVHNLGSCNRLIVLEGTYIELLGWPPGAPPRAKIADSPFGLEALVFRTHDAEATYERLRAAGFAVNPVQELSRPALLDGREVTARFHTVRFAEQPLPGIRMYFCRHLTPECVWSPALMSHPMARAACAHRCPRGRRPCRRATPGAGRRRDRASWQGRRLGRAAGQSADPCQRGPASRAADSVCLDAGEPGRRALRAGYRALITGAVGVQLHSFPRVLPLIGQPSAVGSFWPPHAG